MARGDRPVDFGFAETLAFASLLQQGIPVRLSGQDSRRGTFGQRHAVLTDTVNGEEFTPLAHLDPPTARFDVFNSMLSEAAVLGFEYGYSRESPDALVLWEAQFGDFVNGAQVIVDQFIAAGEDKWGLLAGLVLLLPHGYEGQGPEHSSARLERFLNLCAGHNMRVANCSTAGQYFHLLRRQAAHPVAKPLVLMTPKSLLRSAEAGSPVQELTDGYFQPVIGDIAAPDPSSVRRVLLCSGKLYYDLIAERKKQNLTGVAIVRVEQFYPFPRKLVSSQLDLYQSASDIVWVQEEPANMGGWGFIERKMRPLLDSPPTRPGLRALRYVGREASASPATGSHTIHQMEQARLVSEAFAAG